MRSKATPTRSAASIDHFQLLFSQGFLIGLEGHLIISPLGCPQVESLPAEGLQQAAPGEVMPAILQVGKEVWRNPPQLLKS